MEHSDHDISKLIKKSAKGDTKSCKELYEHLVDKVYAYVRYRTATHEQATDITQDVFIDFFSTLSGFTYQSRAQFYAYVFVITRRKIARHYADVHMRAQGGQVEFDEAFMSDASVDTSYETKSDISQALSSLDEQTREIVVLHHWARYTFVEIALLMSITESAARVRHHRALKTLAGQLEKTNL